MPANDWYKKWFNSPFYHKLYFEQDEQEAQKFISNLLAYLKPDANSRMLDVACGRGRHSKILATNGFDVTGIDLSVDSIHYAQQFAHDHLHFYLHDIRLPFWINYFDYAFNFFTSFGFFPTFREHDNSIRTIANSVKKMGMVVFDYLNVHYAEDHLVHNEVKKIDKTVYEIHRWHDTTHFFKKIIISDPSLEAPVEFTEKVAKLSPGDFTEMLAFHHMQVVTAFGDYQLNAYDIRKTPRMIVVAQKF